MRTSLTGGIKHNPELIDLIFELMFETIWLSPHDQRREEPAFRDFDQAARRLVGLLCATDLATASDRQLQEMCGEACALSDCVEKLYKDEIIGRAAYLRAKDQASRIGRGLEMASSALPEH